MEGDPFASFNQQDSISKMIFNQGEKALLEGEVDIAMGYFLDIIKDKDEKYAEVSQYNVAQCHYRKGEYKKCIERCREFPESVECRALLGLSLFHESDPHSALMYLKDLNKNHDLSDFVKGELDKHLDSIRKSANIADAKFPPYVTERVTHLKNLGNERHKKNDFVGAAKHYKSAIAELERWYEVSRKYEPFEQNPEVMRAAHALHGALLSNLINSEIKLDRVEVSLKNCTQLLSLRPGWKKSYYWHGSCLLANWEFEKARIEIKKCSGCENASKEEVEERLDLIDFCERNYDKLKIVKFYFRVDLFTEIRRTIAQLRCKDFADTITEMVQDTSTSWTMTRPGLVDKRGIIKHFSAPKYEISEKDRNLIGDMKRKEKQKIYIHVHVDKASHTQTVSFTGTEKLKSEQLLTLELVKREVNNLNTFNSFLQDYLS